MLTSVHFFTQFITIVVNIYGQTELKHPILLRGNNKKARLGMRGVLEGSAYCKLVNPTQGHCCLPNGDGVERVHFLGLRLLQTKWQNFGPINRMAM